MRPRRHLPHRATVAGLLVGLVVPVLPAAPAQAQEVPTVPSAPTAVSATAADREVVVSWEAPASDGGGPVDRYVVTVDGGAASTGTCETTPPQPSTCTVAGLTNGVEHLVTVTARNASGTGDPSAPVVVVPATVPGPPTGVTATPGDGQADVTWTAPDDDGGLAVTTYTATATAGGVVFAVCTTSEPTCTLGDLANDTEHAVTVTAGNAAGTGQASAPVTVTPVAAVVVTAPGAPTDVTAERGNSSAVVSWAAPASDGGDPISGYTVTATADGVPTRTCSPTTADLTCTVSQLVNGTRYTVTVSAANGVDSGPASTAVTVTPATVPGAPTGVTAERGNGSAVVSWAAPASNGGDPISGYTVTATADGVPTRTCSPTTADLTCTVSQLVNGTRYTVSVSAANGVDSGPASTAVTVTPATVPGAPTGVTAERSNGSAVVSWTAPASDGGATVTRYEVAAVGDPDLTCSTAPLVSTPEGATTCTVSGLANGTPYRFVVTAQNGVEPGSAPSDPSDAVTPATVPDAPTGVTAERGNGSAVVRWNAPPSDGGSELTGYTVRSAPGGVVCSTTLTTCTATPLVNGVSYVFTVTAGNVVGDSERSLGSEPVTPAGRPLAPTITSAEHGDGSATVTWTPGGDNGSPLTGFAVESTTDASLGCTPEPTTDPETGTLSTSCTVTGLVNGRGYRFRVSATNDLGTGELSATSSEVVPAGVPTAPGPLVLERLDGAVRVSWSPAGDNGRGLEGYRVALEPGGVVRTLGELASTTLFEGLENGVGYTVSVVAINSEGTGQASTGGPITPAGDPFAPTAVVAEEGDGRATVRWTAGGGNGSDVRGFVVAASPGGGTCETGGTGPTTCVVSPLTNGESYTFTVTATNGVGSTTSLPSEPVMPAGTPLAPPDVDVVRGDGSATVTWGAADGNGRDVLGYAVTSATGEGCTAAAAERRCVVEELVNGQPYAFTVTAGNVLGPGLASSSVDVTPAGVPFAPAGVTAVRGDQRVEISWSPAAGNGATVTSYAVVSTDDPDVGCTPTPDVDPVTEQLATSCAVTGLANGSTWSFTVTATNDVGPGAPSTATPPVVPAGLPRPVTLVTAARGDGAATVSWRAADGNGVPVEQYTVRADRGGAVKTVPGTETSAVLTGLVNGTTYAFTVTATNEVGDSTPATSNDVIPAGVPIAPTTVTATRGDTTAVISWNPAGPNGRDVTDYRVVSTDHPDLTCATTSDDPDPLRCTVTGLVNGTTYSFTVTATNAVGDSTPATSNDVIPAGVPVAPTTVTATAADGSAVVTWTAAAPNGDAVVGYEVTAAPHASRRCTTTGATTCAVPGLTNGVRYRFTVTATNTVGTSAPSAPSAEVVPAGRPGASTGVTATPGDTTAEVAWTAPTNQNGSAITGYSVTSSPDGRTCTSLLPRCRVEGLRNATSYTFTVIARNGVGDGPASLPSAGVVPGGKPFAPTAVTAVRGAASAAVRWTAGSDNGRPISGYTVTSAPDGRTCTVADDDATGCTVLGLTNGQPYTFTVVARNAAGESPASSPSAKVVPATAPAAPSGVTVARGDTTVALRWTAADGNGEPVTQYTATSDPGGLTCTSSSPACTVTGLSNGTSYTFTVVATNDVGPGPRSAVSPAVVPATSPSTPGRPVAVRGDGSASVSWTPAADGGAGVTRYTVTSSPGGATCSTDGATTCTVSGLVNGQSYVVTVQAVNDVSDGEVSAPSATVVPAGPPAAPSGVTAQPDAASAHVSWSAASPNGRDVTGYVVQSVPEGLTCETTTATVCTVTGLTDGRQYAFTVTATNEVGATTSPASAPVVPADVPSAPGGVTAEWADGAATLTWTAAADGGAAVTRYEATAAVDGAGCSTPATSCRIAGLRNGTPYTFRVRAHNVMGPGAWSAVTAPVVPAGSPLAATAVTAKPADRSASVQWTAAPDNGRDLLSQTVRAVPSDGSPEVAVEVAGSATSALVTGLTNGTHYAFTVTATNAIGTGATSAPSGAVMPVASPTAPTSVTAVPGDGSALVSWTAADGNGVEVTSYAVTSSPDGVVCTTATTQCTVSGLTNGRTYVFTVVATNAVGVGPASAASTAVVPAGVPTAPTAVVAVPLDGAAQVSWTPAQPNGSPLLGHTVRSTPGDLTCTAAGSSACTVSGLANGTAYAFTVTATNAVGTGAASSASAPVVPATVPGAPASVTVVAGDGSVQVSWPAAPDGGSGVTGYAVTSTPGSLRCATDGATTCTVTGLVNGTSYRFTVVATNRLGAGPPSVASAAVVPATTPAAPTGVRAVAGNGAAQVSWTAPADGGRPVSGYLVTSSPGGVTCRTNTATTCTLTGLVNGTAYAFTVVASNAVGASPASVPSEAVTPSAGAPALPPPPPDTPGPVTPAPVVQPSGPVARSIEAACPAGQVPASGFADVPAGSTHARAIDCLVWWRVANGRTATSYAPSAGVTRDAMAAFVARTVLAAKPGSLPAAPPNAFTDDDGSVHALAVDQLAAVGIVGGTGGGRYSPGATVTRGQMARFLAGAVAHVLGTPLTAERDLFTDDAGSPFETDINRVATVGITGGRTGSTYDPTGPVLRDQMGSFLARTLDVFVEKGASIPR